ncbi:MAG: hypothetical protein WCV71_00900 [Patescibacteria group bacterium]
MKKRAKPKNDLETKLERLDQYDYIDEDLMYKKRDKYAPLIGKFLIEFSNLEHTLDIEIAELLGHGSHDTGYAVLKNLDFSSKIELFYDLVYPLVCCAEKRKEQKLLQIKEFRNKLDNLCVLRNKIAHAKWYTLDKDGYVRVSVKTNKIDGLINFRKLKITPTIIKNGLKRIEPLSEKLSDFTERLWAQ